MSNQIIDYDYLTDEYKIHEMKQFLIFEKYKNKYKDLKVNLIDIHFYKTMKNIDLKNLYYYLSINISYKNNDGIYFISSIISLCFEKNNITKNYISNNIFLTYNCYIS